MRFLTFDESLDKSYKLELLRLNVGLLRLLVKCKGTSEEE